MHEVDLTVYPDECDAFGHLNQASFLSLFERARWEVLAQGAGIEVFRRQGIWPAVRKTVIDYHAPAFPGDVLRFQALLTHRGRTSFILRQTARRRSDDTLVATAEFVFVCIDRNGVPVVVPDAIGRAWAGAAPGGAERITVNGVGLTVEVRGEGPAVLFLHGFPLHRGMWDHQVGALAGWRRIAPDLRGMGGSDAPDLGYSMATYAADLAALLDALGEDRAVLVALSMGGYVAFEFLRRWHRRVAGLVLLDTKAGADTPEGKQARDAMAATARERGARAIAEAMLPKLLAPGAPQELTDRVRDMIENTSVAGIAGALAAMRDRTDSTALLPALRGLPVLVMVGEEDRLTPPDLAREMAEAIPGAELEVIGGAGHVPPMEQPTVTTDRIRRFLEGVGV